VNLADFEAGRRHAFRDNPFSLFRAFHQEIEAVAEPLDVRDRSIALAVR